MRSFSSLLALTLVAATASAQDDIDPDDRSLDELTRQAVGSLVIADTSLLETPYSRRVNGGGEISGNPCPGFFSGLNQLTLSYQPIPGVRALQIFAESQDDTTLRVSVDGVERFCDDDSYGNTNPLVTLSAEQLGDGAMIMVEVGSYDPQYVSAQLGVRAVPEATAPRAADPAPARSTASRQSAPSETVTLTEGFSPDPRIVTGFTAGGPENLEFNTCNYGFVPDEPHAIVSYESRTGRSNLVIFAESDIDTMLFVALDDRIFCDDDSFGDGDPQLIIEDAPSGEYLIWVGAYNESESGRARLYISEKVLSR